MKSAPRRSHKIILVTIVVFLVPLVSGSLLYFYSPKEPESLDVAYPSFESVALYWIAQNQSFFKMNGLIVTSHVYTTGAGSLDGLLRGEADIAVGPAEYPVVARTFQNEKLQIIGTVDKIEFIYLVGRKDRGINAVTDLAGKRVGTASGTIAEFYLGRLLSLHGLSTREIELVDLKTPAEWVNAVVNGTIDAVVTAQPQAYLAKERLGDNAFVLSAQSHQPQFALAVSTSGWIQTHSGTVVAFLKALSQAEDFAQKYPTETKAIIKGQMNFTDEYLNTVWVQNQFGLSLDQSLVAAMEDEARWMLANNLTAATVIPDFLNYVYVDGMVAAQPDSVALMR